MRRVQALELLDDPQQCGRLNMEAFYQLLIRAGYKQEVAHKAALQRGWDRLSAGEKL